MSAFEIHAQEVVALELLAVFRSDGMLGMASPTTQDLPVTSERTLLALLLCAAD